MRDVSLLVENRPLSASLSPLELIHPMNRFAARSLASFAAVVGGSLVVACSSAPDERTSQSSEDIVIPHCPYGQHVDDCQTDEGPRGAVIISCTCAWTDNFFAITDLVGTPPSESTNSNGSWLEVSPDPTKYPYPPELAGAGCSKTAVYHLRKSDPFGGRIWYCPVEQGVAPTSIAPQAPTGYTQAIGTGGHFPSPILGSPKSGWYIVAEEFYGDCGEHCVINHGCSGACTPGP